MENNHEDANTAEGVGSNKNNNTKPPHVNGGVSHIDQDGVLNPPTSDSSVNYNATPTSTKLQKMDTEFESAQSHLNEKDYVDHLLEIPNPPVKPATSFVTCDSSQSVRLRLDPSNQDSTANEEPLTVHSLLARTVREGPEHNAVAYKEDHLQSDWTYLSYLEYYREICAVAKAFIWAGLEPHQSVGILGFNSLEWFLSDLGAIFAGGFACGIYATNTPEACHYILEHSRTTVVVVENKNQLKKVLAVRDRLPLLKAIVQYRGSVQEDDPMIHEWKNFVAQGRTISDSVLEERLRGQAPNECCTLIYTSGTTGAPKAVMLSHDNLTWTAAVLSDSIPSAPWDEHIISYLPLSHVAAQITDIYLPIVNGGTLYFAQPDALKGSLAATLREVRPTLFLGVPRVWEKIADSMRTLGAKMFFLKRWLSAWAKYVGWWGGVALSEGTPVPWGWKLANILVLSKVKQALGLDRCNMAASAAAPLSRDTIDYFLSLGIPLCEVYGMSESTGPHSIVNPLSYRLYSSGLTPEGMATKISKESEICMWGRQVFMGYLESGLQTKEALDEEGWLHSGDLGRLDEDGYLYVTGRIKELIVTAGGENVAPVPIENRVKENLPCISNAMLVGDKMKYLTMLLTLKTTIDPDSQAPLDTLAPATLSWLEELGSTATTLSDVRSDLTPEISGAIQSGIDAANEKCISRAALVQKWTILPRDFSILGGELGPTMKLRRPIVAEMYKDVVADMYKN